MSGLLANPCCGCGNKTQPSCEYYLFDPPWFWYFKETNWPESTPVFDTEWAGNNDATLKNKGAFTLVYDTENPLSNYEYLSIEARLKADSLVGEAGVCFMNPWEPESISLWWLGGTDYELRQGITVLEAIATTAPPTLPSPNPTLVKLVIVNAKSATTDVECWVQGQLVHTETGVSWTRPELLDYGVCVDGEIGLQRVMVSPCPVQCIIQHECGVDTEAPEFWTLQCPTIIQKPKHNPVTDMTTYCQDAISGFFSGGHTLIRQYVGKTQGLVRSDPNTDGVCFPVEYEWVQCPDLSDSLPGVPCSWVAVITDSMSLGVAPYLCYSPQDNPDGFCPDNPGWNCNMVVINNRDSAYFPVSSKGTCPRTRDPEIEFVEVLSDEWFGPSAIGDCSPESWFPGATYEHWHGLPNAETWRIYIRFFDEVPEWQSDQETIPTEGYQVVAFANFVVSIKRPLAGFPGEYETDSYLTGVVYYSDWYTVSQPVPASGQITLEREDVRYPLNHPAYPWGQWYEFPDTITVTPNGTGDNDSYIRYCRGLTCQPIIDPDENTEYTFTMTYELPDESLLVDEPTLTAYFQEEEDSWEWFGPGQPISLVDCPGLGSFYYHIHCIKEANGGRGQWVLDITNASSVTSRLNMIVDEELGITFEGAVTSGCDGQNWGGIMEELRAAPVPQRWGSCLPKGVGIGANIQINCFYDPIADSDQVELRTWDTSWIVAYENTIVRAANFMIDGEPFAIAVWPLNATDYKVEIRRGPLMRGFGGVGTNWHSLAYITDTVGTYLCHPDYGYPILQEVPIPYGWGFPGDNWAHDPFQLCPDVPGGGGGGGGGEVYIQWN